MYEYEDLTNDQKKAFDLLTAGENVMLNGEAGTGKSFTIKAYSDYCRKNKKKIIKLAPTGIAAEEIGGATLHHQFKLKLGPLIIPPYNFPDVLKVVDVIVIDEISMCRIDLFDYTMKMIKMANESNYRIKPIQIILTGDFFQLPPVIIPEERKILTEHYKVDVGNGYAFQSQMWKELKFTTVTLKEVVRQEEKTFCMALEQARTGNPICLKYFETKQCPNFIEDAVYLAGRNRDVDEYNYKKLKELPGELHHSFIIKEGEINSTDYSCDDDFAYKIGAKVMFLINDPEGQYKNGTMGEIIGIGRRSDFDVKFDEDDDFESNHFSKVQEDEEAIQVKTSDGLKVFVTKHTFECRRYETSKKKKEVKSMTSEELNELLKKNIENFGKEEEEEETELNEVCIGTATQFPLRIAYAITMHKSQGQTFDAVNIKPDAFAEGQLYVAISRGRDISKIHFTNRISPSYLKSSKEVIEFYSEPEKYDFFNKKFIEVKMLREQYDDLIKDLLMYPECYEQSKNSVRLWKLKQKAAGKLK